MSSGKEKIEKQGKVVKREVLYEGYLEKKSPTPVLGRHVWQTRYFILYLTTFELGLPKRILAYYKSPDDLDKQTGSIPVDDVKEIDVSTDKNGRFDIIVAGRVYALRADKHDTAQKWIKVIAESIKEKDAVKFVKPEHVPDNPLEAMEMLASKKAKTNQADAEKTIHMMQDGGAFILYTLNETTKDADKNVVMLYYKYDTTLGYLYWTEPGDDGSVPPTDKQKLPLRELTDLFLGHQTPTMLTKTASKGDLQKCFSVRSKKNELNFEGDSKEQVAAWLFGINSIMISKGQKRLRSVDPPGTNTNNNKNEAGSTGKESNPKSLEKSEAIAPLLTGSTFNLFRTGSDGVVVKETKDIWYEPANANSGKMGCFHVDEVNVRSTSTSAPAGHQVLFLHLVSDVYLGKHTAEMKSPAAKDSPAASCFSLMTREQGSLHLAARGDAVVSEWIAGIKYLLTNSGKKVAENRTTAAAAAASAAKNAAAAAAAQKAKEEVNAPKDKTTTTITPASTTLVSIKAPETEPLMAGSTFTVLTATGEKTENGIVIVTSAKKDVWYEPPNQYTGKMGCFHVEAVGNRKPSDANSVSTVEFPILFMHLVRDVYLGKQAPEMKSSIAQGFPSNQCLSLMTKQGGLHLIADSPAIIMTWINGIKFLVTNQGRALHVNAAKPVSSAVAAATTATPSTAPATTTTSPSTTSSESEKSVAPVATSTPVVAEETKTSQATPLEPSTPATPSTIDNSASAAVSSPTETATEPTSVTASANETSTRTEPTETVNTSQEKQPEPEPVPEPKSTEIEKSSQAVENRRSSTAAFDAAAAEAVASVEAVADSLLDDFDKLQVTNANTSASTQSTNNNDSETVTSEEPKAEVQVSPENASSETVPTTSEPTEVEPKAEVAQTEKLVVAVEKTDSVEQTLVEAPLSPAPTVVVDVPPTPSTSSVAHVPAESTANVAVSSAPTPTATPTPAPAPAAAAAAAAAPEKSEIPPFMINGATFTLLVTGSDGTVSTSVKDVWYEPPNATSGKMGCFHSDTVGQRTPSQTPLLLHQVKDVFMGKQAPEMNSPAAASYDAKQCFSLITKENGALHLIAADPASAARWLKGIKLLYKLEAKRVEESNKAKAAAAEKRRAEEAERLQKEKEKAAALAKARAEKEKEAAAKQAAAAVPQGPTVGEWLAELGPAFAVYEPKFAGMTLNEISHYTEDDLNRIGITSGVHKKKILPAIAKLAAARIERNIKAEKTNSSYSSPITSPKGGVRDLASPRSRFADKDPEPVVDTYSIVLETIKKTKQLKEEEKWLPPPAAPEPAEPVVDTYTVVLETIKKNREAKANKPQVEEKSRKTSEDGAATIAAIAARMAAARKAKQLEEEKKKEAAAKALLEAEAAEAAAEANPSYMSYASSVGETSFSVTVTEPEPKPVESNVSELFAEVAPSMSGAEFVANLEQQGTNRRFSFNSASPTANLGLLSNSSEATIAEDDEEEEQETVVAAGEEVVAIVD